MGDQLFHGSGMMAPVFKKPMLKHMGLSMQCHAVVEAHQEDPRSDPINHAEVPCRQSHPKMLQNTWA